MANNYNWMIKQALHHFRNIDSMDDQPNFWIIKKLHTGLKGYIPEEHIATILGKMKISTESMVIAHEIEDSGLLAEYIRLIKQLYVFSIKEFDSPEFFLESAKEIELEFK